MPQTGVWAVVRRIEGLAQFRLATDRDGFEVVIQDLLARGVTGAKIKKLLHGA